MQENKERRCKHFCSSSPLFLVSSVSLSLSPSLPLSSNYRSLSLSLSLVVVVATAIQARRRSFSTIPLFFSSLLLLFPVSCSLTHRSLTSPMCSSPPKFLTTIACRIRFHLTARRSISLLSLSELGRSLLRRSEEFPPTWELHRNTSAPAKHFLAFPNKRSVRCPVATQRGKDKPKSVPLVCDVSPLLWRVV